MEDSPVKEMKIIFKTNTNEGEKSIEKQNHAKTSQNS